MKLLDLQNGETNVWEEKGYLLPKYDREELKKKNVFYMNVMSRKTRHGFTLVPVIFSVHFRLQNYRIC